MQGRVFRIEAYECDQRACMNMWERARGWQSEGGDVSPFEPPPSGEHTCFCCSWAMVTLATHITHLANARQPCRSPILEIDGERRPLGAPHAPKADERQGLRGCGVGTLPTTPDLT